MTTSGVVGLNKKFLDLAVNPWVIISSVTLGVLIGWFAPNFSTDISVAGKVYISLLQMCILPIIITAIVSSLARLLASGEASGSLKRIFTIFFFGLLIASVISVGVTLLIQPGASLNQFAERTLGQLLAASEMSAEPVTKGLPNFIDFMKLIIPTNPFAAASSGKNLAVVFFSILLGLSLGLVQGQAGKTTLSVFEALFDASLRLITWVMYALPLGLICIFAGNVASTGFTIFLSLGKFIVTIYLVSFVLLSAYVFVMWRRSNLGFWRTLNALKEPIFVAMSTSSSFATIPVAMKTLEQKFGLNRQRTNLTLPLGMTLNPHGNAMFFVVVTLFMSQLYDTPIGWFGMFFVLFGSMIASISIAGVPGIAALFMVAIILDPLGLPSSTAVILLLTVEPILDPIVTTVNVMANCAATSILDESHRQSVSETTQEQQEPTEAVA